MSPTVLERLSKFEEKLSHVDSQLTEIRQDVNSKHAQNRSSVHALNNKQQEIIDKIHTVELKQMKYGVITGFLLFIIREVVSYMVHGH